MGEGGLKTKLARFLLQYRNAPQGTTGQSPAELMMGRRLRSESLDIERFHFRRAILDLEQVAPLVDGGGGLDRTFTIDGESI